MWRRTEAADSSSAVRTGERSGEVFALPGKICDEPDERGGREAGACINANVLGDGRVRAGGIRVVIDGRKSVDPGGEGNCWSFLADEMREGE